MISIFIRRSLLAFVFVGFVSPALAADESLGVFDAQKVRIAEFSGGFGIFIGDHLVAAQYRFSNDADREQKVAALKASVQAARSSGQPIEVSRQSGGKYAWLGPVAAGTPLRDPQIPLEFSLSVGNTLNPLIYKAHFEAGLQHELNAQMYAEIAESERRRTEISEETTRIYQETARSYQETARIYEQISEETRAATRQIEEQTRRLREDTERLRQRIEALRNHGNQVADESVPAAPVAAEHGAQ